MTNSMTDRLNRNTTPWKPEPGDIVTGRVVDIEMFDGKFGTYPLLMLETDDGDEIAVHAFHTVLKSELARKRPQPGDLIGIKFQGDPEGRGYQAYKVRLERKTPSAGVDYDRLAVEAAADQVIDDALTAEPLPEPPPDYDDF